MAEIKGIDGPAVTAWFEEHVAGAQGPFEFALIAGGHSNLTFGVTDANGKRYVLRRPPLGQVLATAHDMGREHKIISALGPTDVPVAPALGLCTDESVNGAPFYVMDFVDGLIVRDASVVDELTPRGPPQHRALDRHHPGEDPRRRPRRRRARRPRQEGRLRRPPAEALVRAVGEVEDPRAGRDRRGPRGAAVPHPRPGPGGDRPRRLPPRQLHDRRDGRGDRRARLGALHPGRPDGRRRAARRVLDRPGRGRRAARPPPPRKRGSSAGARSSTPTREASGRDLSQVDFYIALGFWKLACIVEGVYARYAGGSMGSDGGASGFEGFKHQVEHCARQAAAAVERLG